MSIAVMAWGTGDPKTRAFSVLADSEGHMEPIGAIRIRLTDIPDLIAELSEWAEEES